MRRTAALARLARMPAAAAMLLVAACGITPGEDEAFRQAQQRIDAARGDTQVRKHGAVPLSDAERTLRQASEAGDRVELRHLVYLVDKKLDIAQAVTERRVAEERLAALQERSRQESAAARLAQEMREEQLSTALREARDARKQAEAVGAELSNFKSRETARGTVLSLPEVLFDANRAELAAGSERALDSLVAFLRRNPQRRVVVEGHADDTGSKDANLKLSLARANAVKAYLSRQGIDGQRMLTLAHGDNYPVAANDTAEGRQRNRRVEILIERRP